jgi:hypothetical protein
METILRARGTHHSWNLLVLRAQRTDDRALRQRQQGRHAAQLARRPSCRRCSRRCACASRPARPASPCIRGRMPATSRGGRARDRGAPGRRWPAGGVQHRGRSASRSAGPRARRRGRTQCTLVPVRPGEITSQAGWPPDTPAPMLARVIGDLRAAGIRVSLFVDPGRDRHPLGGRCSAPTASSCTRSRSPARSSTRGAEAARPRSRRMPGAAELAHARPGRERRPRPRSRQPRAVPDACRTSTRCRSGTRSISRALFVGLDRQSVREYLEVLAPAIVDSRRGKIGRS